MGISRGHVLVVDDNVLNRMMLARAVEKQGHQVTTAEDGRQALALLREALLEHPKNYEAIVQIAELYMEQRELRKASLYLKQAITLDPNNAALRVQLQTVEKALGTQSSQ